MHINNGFSGLGNPDGKDNKTQSGWHTNFRMTPATWQRADSPLFFGGLYIREKIPKFLSSF